ncbi:Protein of unknown function DUF1980 [Desulfofarcimen acetoxidans DSM 771]|uniref:TIGR03943 family protein n=1 Tax=Desulfofarcimen acetoxidans (strain ATCC 49208 / DSM 771 / KCTC 5769 / VKM B-1644 / 5575) TaxID=485916 RepID=C8W436_DESAS|nr:TIGR03943 family protein [Desulfofarcimen acetoxidans]ACV61290.1 Protein of unknown function DUF1980 [Desulfofarcimen acetoxidans DSM 771]
MKSLVRLLALLILNYTLLKLLKTEQITYYINPRFIPLTKFALVFLMILSLFTLNDLLRAFKSKENGFWSLKGVPFLLLLAVLTPLAFSPKVLDSSMANQKGMISYQQGSQDQAQDNSINRTSTSPNENDLQSVQQLDDSSSKNRATQTGPVASTNGVFQLNDNNYYIFIGDLYNNKDKYIGKEIEVDGFIMHIDLLGPNQFLAARYLMACCAADASVIGFAVESKAPYPDNTWVRVRGKLTKIDDNGPYLKLTKIQRITQPADPYIYP